MASIYRRPPGSRDGIFWVAFYHPVTGTLVRRSLDTADRARAERICAHVEALCKATSPSAPVLPDTLREILVPEDLSKPCSRLPSFEGEEGGISARQAVLPLLEAKPTMPSIYPRPADAENPTYWVALYHPTTGAQIRKSLETRNREEAERRVRNIDAICDLIATKDIELPVTIVDALGARELPLVPSGQTVSASPSISVLPSIRRCTVETALRSLLSSMLVGNDPHYLDNAISYCRRLFGSVLVEKVDPRPKDQEREAKRLAKNKGPDCRIAKFRSPGITAYYLDEITAEIVTTFLAEEKFGIDSCRHYKEFVRRLINHAIESGLYVPANVLAPNPMKSLPSFVDTERDIVVLSGEDEAAMLAAVASNWRLNAGIRCLLGTGMRLHEMLSVRVEDVMLEEGYLRLLKNNRAQSAPMAAAIANSKPRALRKNKSTRKRGERAVALMPDLQEFLRCHLAHLKAENHSWLVPSPTGMRWSPNNFGKALHELTLVYDIPFTAADMRSTYATR